MLEPNTEAPTFTLPNQDGEPVSLPETGTVVVYFYPRADTPGCTTEACGFRDHWAAFEARNISVFGISDDPVVELAEFAAEYELPLTLLSDEEGRIAAAYDSYGQKKMFGNTFDGVFRNTYVVENGLITHVYEGVNPEDHASEILVALDDI
jgi:peroxiredoxin Q/BCP